MPHYLRFSRNLFLTYVLIGILIGLAITVPNRILSQRAKMQTEARYCQMLNQQFAADSAFQNVRCIISPADSSLLVIQGSIADSEQFHRLQVFVEYSHPPANWHFSVKIKPDAPH